MTVPQGVDRNPGDKVQVSVSLIIKHMRPFTPDEG
jgi:hypothetical protein